ncbi:hypothetical protein D3C80_1717040 [compost metagenome]
MVEAVIQRFQGAFEGRRHFLGRDGTVEHHREQGPQKRQVAAAQYRKAAGRGAGRATAEAGAQARSGEEGGSA